MRLMSQLLLKLSQRDLAGTRERRSSVKITRRTSTCCDPAAAVASSISVTQQAANK